jgi:magnesium transporter
MTKKELKSDVNYLTQTSMIEFNLEESSVRNFKAIADIILVPERDTIQWLNTYGLQFSLQTKKIINNNHLDDFLINLLIEEEHRNKVIELDDSIFMTFRTIHYVDNKFITEQMMFVTSPGYVWSIQEKKGDYFQHIRERISENKGIVRKKNADYLLYLIVEAIIDNYYTAYDKLTINVNKLKDLANVKPSPTFAIDIENNKQNLFILKKAVSSLREAITKLEKIELKDFEENYFSELKEQASFLIDDIDFDLQQLESSINLIFNMQSHRLNEVMKTLTILSVIFIPLTFLAGIYGMNFDNIPELHSENGYYILLSVMAVVAVGCVIYFKRKNWLD